MKKFRASIERSVYTTTTGQVRVSVTTVLEAPDRHEAAFRFGKVCRALDEDGSLKEDDVLNRLITIEEVS